MRDIKLIVIHCSATRENRSFPVTSLIACHDARFGFTGYHYYITRDGQLYQTRHENLPGAHARHYNQHSIGICYEGGLDAMGEPCDTRTKAQRQSMRALLERLTGQFPSAIIMGHRDLSPDLDGNGRIDPDEWQKQCPCFDALLDYADLEPAGLLDGTLED